MRCSLDDNLVKSSVVANIILKVVSPLISLCSVFPFLVVTMSLFVSIITSMQNLGVGKSIGSFVFRSCNEVDVNC